jgi:hypothetical protein
MVDVYDGAYHLLKQILSGKYASFDIERLVKIVFQISLDRLILLVKLGRLNIKNIPISLNSIAMDCIADLFKRDNSGCLIEIVDFFSGDNDINNLQEDEVKSLFRSLVFTAVNDGMANIFKNYDPIYNKILQNIRYHIRTIPGIKKIEMFNEIYIYSCKEVDLQTNLMAYPVEELEYDLSPLLKGNENSKDYLLLILGLLNEQDKYRRCYSLASIANVIKRIISRRMKDSIETIYSVNDELLDHDIPEIVARCIYDMKMFLNHKFLGKNKISEDLFDKYFAAIEEIIFCSFVQNDGVTITAYDCLKKYYPEITQEEYKNEHCNRFEYMIKIAKNKVKEDLKELL